MQNHRFLFFVLATFLISSCTSTNSESNSDVPTELNDANSTNPVFEIEKAHAKAQFTSKQAIEFDLVLEFGGTERFNGKLILSTDSEYGILEINDSTKIYINGDKVYYPPSIKNDKSIRFTAYTWSYFFLFPYKLNDGGTIWSKMDADSVDDKKYNTRKLTFEDGTGDSPEDWYLIFSDPNSNLLEYAVYIVTASKSIEEAEKDPHAIQYLNYRNIEGIPLAHDWVFWEWRESDGFTKKLGKASLRNFNFIELNSGDFTAPDHYIIK